MPWLNAVQNRILNEIQLQPTMRRRLVEVLLWRGFLVWEEAGHIYLARGATASDARDIESLRSFPPLIVVARADTQDHCAEVRWRYASREAMDAVIEGILQLPAPQGMTGICEHPDFGDNFPATELDLGVGLLVRGLNRLGLPTKISGHGDIERCKLFVEFANDASGRIFRDLFDKEFALRVSDPEVFTSGRGPYGSETLTIGHATENEEVAYRFFSSAHELALLLHRPVR